MNLSSLPRLTPPSDATPADAGPNRSERKPLIRSAGVRFAVVYAVVFGISSFALALSLWYSTVGLLQRQAQNAILNDATTLGQVYATGGTALLIVTIRGRLSSKLDDDVIYDLTDPLGGRLAGNLDHWPATIKKAQTWYEFTVTRSSAPTTALLRA